MRSAVDSKIAASMLFRRMRYMNGRYYRPVKNGTHIRTRRARGDREIPGADPGGGTYYASLGIMHRF